mgnify:CR=1 FL=1
MTVPGALHISQRREMTIPCEDSPKTFIKKALALTSRFMNSTAAEADPTGYLNLAGNALLSIAASGITSIPAASARNTRAKRFQIIRKSM